MPLPIKLQESTLNVSIAQKDAVHKVSHEF